MKSLYCIILSILASILLDSCEKYDAIRDSGFQIIFSDGKTISENDIQFYDTSSHLLYLKNDLNLSQNRSSFNAIVEGDTIYQGEIFPAIFSSRPKQAIFILDYSFYGNNIIEINCWIDSLDYRNNPRIINALQKSNLLHYGILCNIDEIRVSSFADYSSVSCKITVKNNDNFSYYIIDPAKMGELDFNYYTGGLFFNSLNLKPNSFLKWSISNPEYNDLTINDLTLLKVGQEVQYTFNSSDYYKMEKGVYRAAFRFQGFRDIEKIKLEQKNGRIWVGSLYSVKDVVVE